MLRLHGRRTAGLGGNRTLANARVRPYSGGMERIGQTFKNRLDEPVYIWVEPSCLGFELMPAESLTVRISVSSEAGLEPLPVDLERDSTGMLVLMLSDQGSAEAEFLIDGTVIARGWTPTEAGRNRIKQ
jgi:hypothetical protein